MKRTNLIQGFNLRTTLFGHSDIIHRIAWSPKEEKLASPSRDKTVIIWNSIKGKLEAKLLGHEAWVNCVVWSPNGDYLASGDEHGNIIIWDIKKESSIKVLELHRGRIECIDWSPDGKCIGTASADGTVNILQIDDWKNLKRIYDHHNWVNAIAWSKDGRFLATGAEDNTVKIWETKNYSLLHTLSNNQDWITDLAWSPNGRWLAHTTGSTIKIWNPKTGQLDTILEGHEGKVRTVSFSCDGFFLVSKSEDNTFKLWDTESWKAIRTIEEDTIREVNPEAKITFHPKYPILASLGENDKKIRIWDYNASELKVEQSDSVSIHYANAKVVLIGKSGVGKTCLARALMGEPFVPQASTHGMNVHLFHTETIKVKEGNELRREIMLWDLAGQTDYKLIHQLFFDETSLGIFLFDPSEHELPFKDVEYWNKALKKINKRSCPKFLVAARIDRGQPAVTQNEISEIKNDLDFQFYLKISAKTGHGINELKNKISEFIPWNDLPITSSPILWNSIRNLILKDKEKNNSIVFKNDLIKRIKIGNSDLEFSNNDFDIVLTHAQAQGLLWQFSFGDLILLKPELINLYSSTIILNARNHPKGIGAVKERNVLEGKIDFYDCPRLDSKSLETSLLYSVIELIIKREIGIRIGEHIVFPSKFNRKFPNELTTDRTDFIFLFEGRVETIYSTLLVRLFYSEVFDLEEIWRNGSIFSDPLKNKCGITIKDLESGNGEIKAFFDIGVKEEFKILFTRFIEEHLEKHSIQNSLIRETVLRCNNCGEEVEGKRAVKKRMELGKKTITCLFCDKEIPLSNIFEKKYDSAEIRNELYSMNRDVDANKSIEINTTKSRAKVYLNEFDVFMAHNNKDKADIIKIKELLEKRGLTPWIDVEQIPPGRWFQDIIQETIRKIKSAAIFIGNEGLGKWQTLELRAFISQCVERDIPIIPILLPGVNSIPKELVFLKEFNWVKYSDNIESDEMLDLIEFGITGIYPRNIKM